MSPSHQQGMISNMSTNDRQDDDNKEPDNNVFNKGGIIFVMFMFGLVLTMTLVIQLGAAYLWPEDNPPPGVVTMAGPPILGLSIILIMLVRRRIIR